MFETYPGGKNGSGVYQAIINQIPPHYTYVEGFLGGGAIMRRKRPADVNIGIDADPNVIYAWSMNPPQGAPSDVILHCRNFQDWIILTEHIQRDTFIYLDPPYLMDTRSTQDQYYLFDMADRESHERLLLDLQQVECMVMISGYRSALYADLLHDWRMITYTGMTRRGPREECLWMNYPEPTALHDYRYLGEGYRERERIQRKVRRWKARLARMDRLERLAIMEAISEV